MASGWSARLETVNPKAVIRVGSTRAGHLRRPQDGPANGLDVTAAADECNRWLGPKQLIVDLPHGAQFCKTCPCHDSDVLARGLEAILVALGVLRNLEMVKTWHALSWLPSKKVERPQLHCGFVEIDPNDAAILLRGESGMGLIRFRGRFSYAA